MLIFFFKEELAVINHILTDHNILLTVMFTQLRAHESRQILDSYEMAYIVVSQVLQI